MRGVTWSAVSTVTVLVLMLVLSPAAQAAEWQPTTTPTSALLRSVDFHDEANGLAVGTGHTVLVTNDGGETWTETDGGRFGFGWYDVAWASPTTAYAVGANAIFQPTVAVSHNGGQSWLWDNFYIMNNEGTVRGVAVTGTHVLIAATLWNGEGVILQKPLTNLIESEWTPVFTVSHPLVGIDADGPFAVAVGADGGTYVSHTGGLIWAPAQTPTNAFLEDVSVSLPNAIAVGSDGVAIRSTDLGLSWSASETHSDVRLRSVALTANGSSALVGDDGTVRTSTDAGATWGREDSGTTASLWGVAMQQGLSGDASAWAVGFQGTALVREA